MVMGVTAVPDSVEWSSSLDEWVARGHEKCMSCMRVGVSEGETEQQQIQLKLRVTIARHHLGCCRSRISKGQRATPRANLSALLLRLTEGYFG